MWNIFGDGPLEWSEDADAALYARIDGPLAWQQHALCAQTDPEAFFPEKGGSTREARSTRWQTMSASASGVACLSARGGACAVWPVEPLAALRRRDPRHEGRGAAHSVRPAGHRESIDGPALVDHH